jgi:hypothetical protein
MSGHGAHLTCPRISGRAEQACSAHFPRSLRLAILVTVARLQADQSDSNRTKDTPSAICCAGDFSSRGAATFEPPPR